MVEASPPWETVWGVGLHNSKITDKGQRKEENLLGKLLMEVREELRKKILGKDLENRAVQPKWLFPKQLS